MRAWFEAAADVFVAAYRDAMCDHGLMRAVIDGILARSRLSEAALLVKIATRRVHRLGSPRAGELSAMLDEIAGCLSGGARSE